MSDEDASMRVTLRDVYSLVQQVATDVASIKGASELHAAAIAAGDERARDHETRIRAVERRVWALPSIATILAGGSVVVSLIGVLHSYGH